MVVRNDEQPNLRQNEYHIYRCIGKGSWGSVYLVSDNKGDLGAIKVYDLSSEALYQMNERNLSLEDVVQKETNPFPENCPDIVPAKSKKDLDGIPYLWMPAFACSLASYQFLTVNAQTVSSCLRLYSGAVRGVSQYHEKARRVHGDINPSNILIRVESSWPYETLLGDLGGSSLVSSTKWSSNPRHGIGNRGTRAPEQFYEGSHPTTQSDVHALAASFLFTLTGRTPYGALASQGNFDEAMSNLSSEEASRQVEHSLKGLPFDVKRFLRKALAFNPSGRFADGAVFEQAFLKLEKRYAVKSFLSNQLISLRNLIFLRS